MSSRQHRHGSNVVAHGAHISLERLPPPACPEHGGLLAHQAPIAYHGIIAAGRSAGDRDALGLQSSESSCIKRRTRLNAVKL